MARCSGVLVVLFIIPWLFFPQNQTNYVVGVLLVELFLLFWSDYIVWGGDDERKIFDLVPMGTTVIIKP